MPTSQDAHNITTRATDDLLSHGPLLVWGALFMNVLAFSGLDTFIPIPTSIGKVVTQGALVVAVFAALLANPRGIVRPNLFMVLLSLLAVVSLTVSLHNEFFLGSTFRAARLITFVAVLWLLTPFWAHPNLPLLKAHLMCLRLVVASVAIGAVVAPGAAFSYGGRLSGALWPIPPTQVAHYAAVLLGCTALLWFAGAVRTRTAVITVAVSSAMLVGAHTRTAVLALVVGLGIAGASMFVGHARVRRLSAVVAVAGVFAAAVFAPFINSWLWRGQSADEASQLTGRTKVWSMIADLRRPWAEEVFGSGLSNKSFDGLPIDSNWLAVYLDQGWFGIAVDAALLLILVLLAATNGRGLNRALALFLVAYCAVASITETGLGDASPYLLELFVAASLIATPGGGDR